MQLIPCQIKYKTIRAAKKSMKYEALLQQAVVGLDGEADGVEGFLWQQNADVAAVGVIFGNAVLAVQKTVASCPPTVIVDVDGVLCETDGVGRFLVIDTACLHE